MSQIEKQISVKVRRKKLENTSSEDTCPKELQLNINELENKVKQLKIEAKDIEDKLEEFKLKSQEMQKTIFDVDKVPRIRKVITNLEKELTSLDVRIGILRLENFQDVVEHKHIDDYDEIGDIFPNY